jgi:hypothetical protein
MGVFNLLDHVNPVNNGIFLGLKSESDSAAMAVSSGSIDIKLRIIGVFRDYSCTHILIQNGIIVIGHIKISASVGVTMAGGTTV